MAKHYKVFEKEKKIIYVIGTLTEKEKAEVLEYKDLAGYTINPRQPKVYNKGINLKMIDEWIDTKSKNKEEDLEERNKAYNTISSGKKKSAGWLGVRTWFKQKYPKEYARLDKDAK